MTLATPHRLRLGCGLFLRALGLVLLLATIAPSAASAAPSWRLTSLIPDHVTPGKEVVMFVYVENAGDQPLTGNITLNFKLPDGVVPAFPPEDVFTGPEPSCSFIAQVLECTAVVDGTEPDSQRRYRSTFLVESDATGVLPGVIEVSGGGAEGVSIEPFMLDTAPIGPFSIKSLDVSVGDAFTYPSTQAGVDPATVDTEIAFPSSAQTNLEFPNLGVVSAPAENFRNVVAHVPVGLIGNPTATPLRCTAEQLATPMPHPVGGGLFTDIPTCPLESQVGLVQFSGGDIVPLYNMVPPSGSPAAFGFNFLSVLVSITAEVRSADNGIDIVAEKNVSSAPIPRFAVTFWGIPADPSHDRLRGLCLAGGAGYNSQPGFACPFDSQRHAFLRNPTSCSGEPLPWSVEVDTYQHPGTYVGKSATTPAIEGCENLPFDPSISLPPSDRAVHAPSGLDLELTLPQDTSPDGLAEADLRAAEVTLPEGMSLNPASADGLAACSDTQLRLGLDGPAQCPDGSKLGSVEVDTPLLDEAIGGSVFLRSQASNDPASGDMYRLAIELRSDERGVAIKLPGSLKVDPNNGQLTTAFDDLPQLPFESMRVQFRAGPRAALTTPSSCGTYSTHAELTSWSGKTVSLEPSFTVDQGCTPPPFAPGFQAGVQNTTAGAFSPFALRVTRDPGQPNLSRIDATLPEGELAKLAGVPVCSDAQAGAGACPAGSRIGSVVAAIGDGSSPLYLPQAGKSPTSVYLAAPYKGAPYSVLAEVPAQAGPFDLGKVLVRSALRVDPVTTQASVVSDPLPQIFGGVPVAYRDVRVQIDRPEFTVNPTDCEPSAVTGTIGSAAGGSAAVSDRFQVADCAHLAFKPSLSLRLKGKTRRGGNPALTAVLKMPQKGPGANIAKAVVTLPKSEFIAQDHLNNVCTRVQYAANGGGGAGCPKGSVYGRARAFSPLLDYPLEGPVYLRSNGGDRELPDLVASLDGPIRVELVGYVDSDKRTGGLRTTFARVPDAPVSKFVLKMGAGRKSLLENSTNICRGKRRATARFDGQNGKIHDFRPVVKVACGKGARRR